MTYLKEKQLVNKSDNSGFIDKFYLGKKKETFFLEKMFLLMEVFKICLFINQHLIC